MIQSGLFPHALHSLLLPKQTCESIRFQTPILLFQISFRWMSVNYSCYRVTETLEIYHEIADIFLGRTQLDWPSKALSDIVQMNQSIYHCFLVDILSIVLVPLWPDIETIIWFFKKKVLFLSDDLNVEHWRRSATSNYAKFKLKEWLINHMLSANNVLTEQSSTIQMTSNLTFRFADWMAARLHVFRPKHISSLHFRSALIQMWNHFVYWCHLCLLLYLFFHLK